MTEFSKKFLAKSPLRGGLLALGRVIMSPRANTSRFLGSSTSSSSSVKPKYSYSFSDVMKDIKAGVDKKEVLKRYKKSMREGPQYYL